jgi:hypothetical protein
MTALAWITLEGKNRIHLYVLPESTKINIVCVCDLETSYTSGENAKKKTYNSRDSLVVTDPTTNLPA